MRQIPVIDPAGATGPLAGCWPHPHRLSRPATRRRPPNLVT